MPEQDKPQQPAESGIQDNVPQPAFADHGDTPDKVAALEQVSRAAFSEQETAYQQLKGKAERLIAAVGIVVGFQLIDIKGLRLSSPATLGAADWFAALAFLFLAAALLYGLMALQIRSYHGSAKRENCSKCSKTSTSAR